MVGLGAHLTGRAGRQPPTLTLQSLIAADLPPAWPDQRAWVAALA